MCKPPVSTGGFDYALASFGGVRSQKQKTARYAGEIKSLSEKFYLQLS
jgi:hypothetical protein